MILVGGSTIIAGSTEYVVGSTTIFAGSKTQVADSTQFVVGFAAGLAGSTIFVVARFRVSAFRSPKSARFAAHRVPKSSC